MNKEEKTRTLPSEWNRWDTRLPNPGDQIRVIESFKRSGCNTKSDFVRKMVLRGDSRVLAADGSMMEYTTKLTDFIFTVNKMGMLYNRAVRTMNKCHSEAKAEQLLNNVNNQQMELMDKLPKVMSLTKGLKDDCKSGVPQVPTRDLNLQP